MVNAQLSDIGICSWNTDRIVVVGTTGSGKTTLARQIAQKLDMPHVEFDAYRVGPNWTETPDDVFRERLRQALQGDTWVGDGNYYSIARDIIWTRATLLVWLDYPICIVMWRLFWRTLRWGVLGQELWNGNNERLWPHFFSRKSLFLYALRTHWQRRGAIPLALAEPERTHLDLIHLRSPKATWEWVKTLA